jgi:hypothetical protein
MDPDQQDLHRGVHSTAWGEINALVNPQDMNQQECSHTGLKKLVCRLWIDERENVGISNGNANETKANESFDNGVFFDIEAKRTPSKVSKLFSKRSEHIR